MILYHDSAEPWTKELKKAFDEVNSSFLKLKANQDIIVFGAFDLSKNDYEIFDVQEDFEIKIYKQADIKSPLTFVLKSRDLAQFKDEYSNFLLDTATQSLALELDEDV